jgi:hypothetical protein
VSPAELVSYFTLLEESGWTYEEHRAAGGAPWWKARSSPPHAACELHAGLSEGCLVLEVQFAIRPAPDCRLAFWRYLLLVNDALKLVKFALGPGDSLKLAAELPAASCNFASFRDALCALRTYSAQYRREVELLASHPHLATAWLSLAPHSDEPPPINIVSRAREA